MSNNSKNIMGGLFGALYLMCFAFPFGLLFDVFRDKLPLGQFFVNQLVCFIVAWVICYYVMSWYRELLANANKPRDPSENAGRDPDTGADAGAGANGLQSDSSRSDNTDSELPPRTPR